MQAIATVQEPRAVTSRPATLQDLVETFLADQDVAASSRETYRRSVKQFILWLELTGRAENLSTLSREDILAYKQQLQAEKSSYTVSTYLTVVKKLFGWLESQKLYPDITRGVKGAKASRGHRKECLTVEQIRQALASLDRSTVEGLRDFAMFNLLVRTGLRTVEVARAQVGDLRQEAGQAVLWIQGKGRDAKDDFVLLVQETLEPIREYLTARGAVSEEEPLFCSHSDRNRGQALTTRSISRVVKQTLQAIGLDDSRLTAHSMRHTAITLAAAGGASLHQVQAMARHSDPKVTMIYFHNLDRVRAGAERYISF